MFKNFWCSVSDVWLFAYFVLTRYCRWIRSPKAVPSP